MNSEDARGQRLAVVDTEERVDDGQLIVDLRVGERPIVGGGDTRGGPVAFVDLQAEHNALRAEINAAISGVIERGDFVLGEAVAEFERRFAAYCGVAHAVGVDSGWSALELAIRAYGIGPGDEVITAANTFMATVGAIEAAGARPVLVDCDPVSYNLDPERLEAAITPATRAVIPVHLYGRPADMEPITAIAAAHGLVVIEDACQAHGARYHGVRTGALGDAAAFSFYPAKNLGAFGDGGMVVTDSEEVAARLRLLRNLGSPVKYEHTVRGFNHRLDTLHAAVLAVKLRVLDEANARRRRAAEVYDTVLGDVPVVTPATSAGIESVYHLYVVQVSDRDGLRDHLAANDVASGIHYPIPVHLQEAFRDLGYPPGSFPVTERLADRILSLPMHPNLGMEDIAKVAGSVRSFLTRSRVEVRS
jgi:dTDP-4-amino-4,6-dideoxygalactose transaminase